MNLHTWLLPPEQLTITCWSLARPLTWFQALSCSSSCENIALVAGVCCCWIHYGPCNRNLPICRIFQLGTLPGYCMHTKIRGKVQCLDWMGEDWVNKGTNNNWIHIFLTLTVISKNFNDKLSGRYISMDFFRQLSSCPTSFSTVTGPSRFGMVASYRKGNEAQRLT